MAPVRFRGIAQIPGVALGNGVTVLISSSLINSVFNLCAQTCPPLKLAVDPLKIEALRVEFAAHPFEQLIMLFVRGVTDRLQKTPVSPNTAAILGRAGLRAADKPRVGFTFDRPENLFDRDLMLPAVAKIILVDKLGAFLGNYLAYDR